MARTLIRAAFDAAWQASVKSYQSGETNKQQLQAGIRAYLDYVSDRTKGKLRSKPESEDK